MKTKQKKQLTLFDVKRRNQREQKRKRNRRDFRKLLLKIAFSRSITSPIRRAMKTAAAAAIGFEIARLHVRILESVANRIILKNKA